MARKALLCGINAYADAPLRGCLNDVRNLHDLLISTYGFRPEEVRRLEDGEVVKEKLLEQWAWLVEGARPGDTLVFHFSGHGSYVPDRDGDEDDLRDEITCLVDMDFDDPATYLSDDEWYRLAGGVDPAVRLILIKDTCHSGASSRFLRVQAEDGGERTILASEAQVRGRGGQQPLPERSLCNARFLVPPRAPERAWRGETGAVRTSRLAQVPQTSLMACMEAQTAADAPIGGEFHGAFTYHLCQVLRERCDLSSARLIEAVARQLRGRYEQIPQHEGRDLPAPVLGGREEGAPAAPPESPGSPESPEEEGVVVLQEGPAEIGREALAAQEMVYRAHLRFLEAMVALGGGTPAEPGRARAAGRVLVCVHGIGTHRAGYSDAWWRALAPHVGATYGPGRLGQGRREVIWSDLVNRSRSRAPADELAAGDALRAEILAVIEDRRDQAVARSGRTEPPPIPRGGALSFDDFLVYMLDEGMRRRILARFTAVLAPLLATGARVDVISHSWGTVVAYEGLRELEGRADLRGRVAHWFTVGSALSIAPVQARLRPANRPPRDGRAPFPALVDTWVNLDARGDLVGGPLARRFPVSHEHLDLRPVPCRRQWWGGYELTCAHSSYFETSNLRVNRDVFARHILG